jgi:PIN domain protein
MPIGSADALKYFQLSGYRILPVQAEHTLMVETLPHHHKDPFDRILIAQALAEPMRLLTHDALVAKYSDSFIRV